MLVRKTVTVIFCDLTGSTPLGGRTDPEVMRRVLARYFAEMRAAIERHGGTVEKFIGDAVMAVFGVPTVHEDDAFRAVRACEEMRARLSNLNRDLEREHGVRIQIRVGVNTGKVVAAEHPNGDALVTGDVVNTAKRLEESARPGETLIGDLTRRLVGETVEVEPVRSLAVKGKAEPVAAWPLLRVVSDTAPPLARLETPLVGRVAELGRLRRAYARAVEERELRLFTVLGPAGIGKSRLAHELFGTVTAAATVLSGRCLPYGEGITFWPLAEIVRSAGGADAIEATLAGTDDAALVAVRLRGVIGADRTSASAEEAFWAARRYLEGLARGKPLVVCFEDLHWAERTLLDLIEYLLGWSRGSPILVLCLARPELLERQPAWASLKPRAELLELEPLSPSEAETLLDLLAEEMELVDETRRQIAQTAEGNPLFLEQIAAMLAETGQQEVRIPPSIHALLAARLERLRGEERTVLERAAVVGRDFPLGAVVDLCPAELRGSVRRNLLALTRSGLVQPHVPTFAGEDSFRFRHALIREVAYERVSKALRAALHERFAAWLERTVGERITEVEEIVGYHLEQAYRYREQLGPVDEDARGLALRAGELLGAAGRRAFERDDMPAAIKLLDRALSLLTNQDPAYLELLQELSSACWAVGEIARAEVLLNGLMEAAAGAGDPRFEWSARLERAGRRHITDPDATADDLLQVAEDAIQVFEELGDDRELARAWRRLSQVPRARGHYGASQDAIERALVHARRAGDRQEEARLIDNLCTVLVLGPRHAVEAIRRCEELLRVAKHSRLIEANVATSLAGLEAMRGDFSKARLLCARGESIYADLGLQLTIVASAEMAGYVELLAGAPAAAEEFLRRSYEILSRSGKPALLAFPAALVAEALLEQGRYEEADHLARVSEEGAPGEHVETQIRWRRARAKLEAWEGKLEQAQKLAREAFELAEETDALNLQADALVRLAEVLLAAGDEDEALPTIRKALTLYERKGNVASARKAASLLAERVG